MRVAARNHKATTEGLVAICGNPNSGKTTIFNAVTGLNQKVANYPGVTVERVTGEFQASVTGRQRRLTLVDIPGAYSLSAFSPDEYIATAALFGTIDKERRPDAIICVVDALNLERSLYFLLQVTQIGRPIVVALTMGDVAEKRGVKIDADRLSSLLGGIPVVPVIGNRRLGIPELKGATAAVLDACPLEGITVSYGDATENALRELAATFATPVRSRAEWVRILFDVDGPAEEDFLKVAGETGHRQLEDHRERIRSDSGTLTAGETILLSEQAARMAKEVVRADGGVRRSRSERIDRYLLHPVLGPIVLVLLMGVVFQSIFSWAAPFMDLIDGTFASLASWVATIVPDGPLQSLLTDGIIGGVGAVLIFLPQIIILFVFICLLEDSGYMTRAAFLVDRGFRWCGLSGKSFIPMLSSFACAIPGLMATRTIEDRKLRLITIMVAPLMTCSARLPVYAIMIAAFVPYKTYVGVLNLQGLVLGLLYLLGMAVAVLVSFVLQKTIYKRDVGSFIMEMPSYRLPDPRSVGVRVFNRAKSFVLRAGTVIMAITIIIWALSYYPRATAGNETIQTEVARLEQEHSAVAGRLELQMQQAAERGQVTISELAAIRDRFDLAATDEAIETTRELLTAQRPAQAALVDAVSELRRAQLESSERTARLADEQAGQQIRNSYLGQFGRAVEPVFKPLGWDWKISMAVLASFPAREVVIAVLGTIYNLGADAADEPSSLVDMMRESRWEEGEKAGQKVFSVAVALSIMVFFALCCQCGATIVTIRQETGSWYFSAGVFVYMTALAYGLAMITYQVFSHLGA